MNLAEIVRILQRRPSVRFASEIVSYKQIHRAQKAGAIVLDGDKICLTEVGHLLSQATMPRDIREALKFRTILRREHE